MDDIQKSKVRLAHWIDHNVDHLKGYREVAALLEGEGNLAVASTIRRGIELIESANKEFEKALQDLSALAGQPHSHEHPHDPGHDRRHGHDAAHDHEHKHRGD
jgi:hypothetical protein